MDKQKDKISVIIPVYNVEKYLERCIRSVCEQTYTNLEIILVDDGSPDSCPLMCDEYAKKDKRILVIHKSNGGISSARNAALNVATGSYFFFVDSDDYIHPHAIEELYNTCITHDADISIGLHYVERGEQLLIEDPIIDELEIYSSFEGLKELVTDKTMRNYAWNKLFKSELFENIRFPEGKCYEDIATIYLLFHKAHKICRIPKYLYYYQMRDDSISSNVNIEKWFRNCKDIIWAYKQQFTYFEKNAEKQLAQISLYHLVRNTFALIDAGYQSGNSKEAINEINYLLKNKEAIYSNELLTPEAKKRLKIYEKLPHITGLYLKSKKLIQTIISAKNKLKTFLKYHGLGVNKKYNFTLAKGKDTRLVFFEHPCYDNLGDHSVIFSAQVALKKYEEKHQNCQIYIINEEDIIDGIAQLKQCIEKNDIIFYSRSGNTETSYSVTNEIEKKIQKYFSKQRIIVFTQSDCVTTNHSHCCNATEFKDVTSYLNKSSLAKAPKDRCGILLCLCSDAKSILKTSEKKLLQSFCESLSSDLLISSTVTGYNITKEERETTLNTKWSLFGNQKVVVTDNLQGMIFALITETPCVVLNNSNPDILKETMYCDFIFYAKSVEEASELIKYAYEMQEVKNKYISKDVVAILEKLLA